MAYKTIIYKEAPPIGTITLNRPDKLNAINDLMLDEIEAALSKAEKEDEIRYVVLKGAGRCFCAGQDLCGEGTTVVMPPDPRLRSPLTPIFRTDATLMRRWQRILGFPKHIITPKSGQCFLGSENVVHPLV